MENTNRKERDLSMIEVICKSKLREFIENSSERENKVNKKVDGKWVTGAYIPTMSTFKEIDTGKTYVFNANGGNTYIYVDPYSKTKNTYYLGEWIEVDNVPEDIEYTCLSSDLSKFDNDIENRKINNTNYIKNGTKCFTLDTKETYVFNEKANEWVENKFDDVKVNNLVGNYINTKGIKASSITLNDSTSVEDSVTSLKQDLGYYKEVPTKFNVNRLGTTANTVLIIAFDDIGNEFLIKNLTYDDILVSVGDTFDSSCNILIPSDTAQLLRIKTDTFSIMPSATDSKGVEIQCIS